MMRRLVLALVMAMPAVQGPASATPPESARLLTVEIFSTQTVRSIKLTPAGPGCWMQEPGERERHTLSAPLTLESSSGAIRVTPSGAATHVGKQIELSGNFHLQPADEEQEVSAAGVWKITADGPGLKVLLSLPSERYVVAALEGEASPEEPLASLKAMAISIRTFALVNAERHREEGFGLCDSTHCQALRWVRPRPEVEQAVRETAGETLWFRGNRAHIYYTQHCGGVTEDVHNVWPEEHAGYLASHPDPYCVRTSEARWSTQIPLDQLSAIFRRQGWRAPSHIDSVRIVKRTPSGRAMLLEVGGDGPPATISASSFRFAVDRKLGWNRLRSDWYAVSLSHGSLRIDGKGYGHGVGLCQAGASEMARQGHTDLEILSFYFPGAVVRIAANDGGWKQVEGAGWTLLTAAPAGRLPAEGDSAWARATALFPPRQAVHPMVQALPTTELFRQTTGEPGWMLASTRGSNVFLQPAAVLRNNGAGQELLLHEFLHVLVEEEAGPQTPLWLREGLVEALAAGPRQAPAVSEKPAAREVEAELNHPADAAASRRAHLAAAQMAGALVERYGIGAVAGWLRDGVPAGVIKSLALPGERE